MSHKTIPVLPVEAYTSEDWFKLEMEHIFSKTWQYAGLTNDLENPGDYITVQAGLNNILIVLGSDNQLRGFHNICRHRGTQLLRAVGKKQQALTCPYHDWTYDLSGNLISIPEKEKEFPDLDMKKFCLHKASVEVFKGMIWVHPDPNPSINLNKWMDGVSEFLGPHQPDQLVEYKDSKVEKIINANWKIVAENYIDVYHLAHLHSATLNMYDHSKAEFRFIGPHYVFWEPLTKKYFENLDSLLPFKRMEGMTDDIVGAFVPWLFPNLGLSETESTWSVFHAIPLAPDKTKVVIRTKLMEMSDWEYWKQNFKSNSNWMRIMGAKTKYKEQIEGDPMSSGDFMEEDIFACEQLQKSLKSPFFSVGATAKNGESTVRKFQEIVKDYIYPNFENQG